jgi:hypothetical protein
MPGAGTTARIEDSTIFIICQKFEKGGDDTIFTAMMASGLCLREIVCDVEIWGDFGG